MRDLLAGKCYYRDFSNSPEGIATNILASRLEKLVEHGVAEKWTPNDEYSREGYRLTAKGNALEPVLASVAEWGLTHISGTEIKIKQK